jgi:hypothetical protein
VEHPEGKYDLHIDNSLEDQLDADNQLSFEEDSGIRIQNEE